jgi:hypothetical protein
MVNISLDITSNHNHNPMLQYKLYIRLMEMCVDILTTISLRFQENIDVILKQNISDEFLSFLIPLKTLAKEDVSLFADPQEIYNRLNEFRQVDDLVIVPPAKHPKVTEIDPEMKALALLREIVKEKNTILMNAFKEEMVKIYNQFPIVASRLPELAHLDNLNEVGEKLMSWMEEIENL